jgi:hypothetical protein
MTCRCEREKRAHAAMMGSRPPPIWAMVTFAIGLVVLVVVAVALVGCGGGWTASDTLSATDAVRAQMAVEAICGDAGECKPSQVRALERMSYCANASMLARHGGFTHDGGIECLPR